ncbi:MAG: alpha/beta-type small acid-soluble spore protein [Clostridium sp.]|jgi:hypothetical protein|nr:alpha/beta-type small acid-soluble spore protein [Clostridium sp.]
MAKSAKKAAAGHKGAHASADSKKQQKLSQMKQEAANAVGVTLKQGDNGHLTSRQAGSIGGEMVKKMIESYEQSKK